MTVLPSAIHACSPSLHLLHSSADLQALPSAAQLVQHSSDTDLERTWKRVEARGSARTPPSPNTAARLDGDMPAVAAALSVQRSQESAAPEEANHPELALPRPVTHLGAPS